MSGAGGVRRLAGPVRGSARAGRVLSATVQALGWLRQRPLAACGFAVAVGVLLATIVVRALLVR